MNEDVYDVVPREHSLIFVPDVAKAIEAWNAYQNLVKSLLDDSDYATISGKKHRKRSGWAKLRRAFNITTTIIDHAWEDLGDGELGFYVVVRATFPDGRCEDGDGYCDSTEKRQGGISATRHNVRSKAITRAKNRATADLIGTGEVSAEEFIDDNSSERRPRRQRSQRQQQQRQPAKKNGRPLESEKVRAFLHQKSGEAQQGPITESQIPFVARKFQEAFANESDPRACYHTALGWIWGVETSKELTFGQASATLDWLLHPDGPDDTGDTPLHEHAPEEAKRVLRQALKDAGQADMFEADPQEIDVQAEKSVGQAEFERMIKETL